MPFKRLLTNLVESVPGATGAILADWEGEAVEQHCQGDPFEMKVTAAHWGILLTRLKEMYKQYEAGQVQESIISTDAEGRLVLSDALTYAQQQFSPRAMIDVAAYQHDSPHFG